MAPELVASFKAYDGHLGRRQLHSEWQGSCQPQVTLSFSRPNGVLRAERRTGTAMLLGQFELTRLTVGISSPSGSRNPRVWILEWIRRVAEEPVAAPRNFSPPQASLDIQFEEVLNAARLSHRKGVDDHVRTEVLRE